MMQRDEQQTRTLSSSEMSALQCTDQLDDSDTAVLVSFFKLLDSWDRERERNAKVM
jgi:hypothetical protein